MQYFLPFHLPEVLAMYISVNYGCVEALSFFVLQLYVSSGFILILCL